MRAENLAILLGGSLYAVGLFLQMGCSSVPASSRIPLCLTDPKNNAMHCDGVTRPWSDSEAMVCYPLALHELVMGSCR